MALAIILLRFIQYGSAAILFGIPFFFLYSSALSDEKLETRPILLSAAAALVLAAPLGFLAQLVQLAGSLPAAMDPAAIHIALFDMNFGKSFLARIILALLALAAIALLSPGRRLSLFCAGLGLLICGSFAWMGHGAASQGSFGLIHLAADIIHVLAASTWIGALVVFSLAIKQRVPYLPIALADFAGTGTLLVALLILTGLINNAFLVGWDVTNAFGTPYGQILAAKLMLFVVMLMLAAMNRYRLTPALTQLSEKEEVFANLRRSIMLETVAGFGILAAVSWLGTLAPVLG